MTLTKAIQMVFVVGGLSITAHAAAVFNFDTDSLGTSSTFTDKVNGLSATFASSADAGGFVVYSSIFQTLTGNVLGDPGPAGIDGLALNIVFSQDLSALTLNFATADFSTPSPLTITAFENLVQVGSSTQSGMFLNGSLFPEGEIALGGAFFNSVTISSTAIDFAVDNITVATAPEPASVALFAISLLAFSITGLRRRLKLNQ